MTALLSMLDRPDLFKYALILAIPIYIGIAKIFFGGWHDFLDALRLMFQPDWLSALRGEWHQDNWASLKFLCYLVLCAAFVTMVYKFLLSRF